MSVLDYLLPVRLQLDWTSITSRQKINLPANQKGYDTVETTVGKLSARRIQICVGYFCLGIILKVVLNNFQNIAYTQIWIRLVGYSSFEVLDPSEVPRIDSKLIF